MKTLQGELWLTYSDNGKGLTPESDTASGLGMQNIRSRIGLMQGEMNIKQKEQGFEVVLKSKLKP